MVDVYLPEWYDPTDSTRRYPVVYFLHGWGYDQDDYMEIETAWASSILNKTIDPVILVKPDGSSETWKGSWYTNSEYYGLFEDYIVYDLMTYIDSAYNTIDAADKRSIMGHSTGGCGAVKLALKHPDVFRGVASHSGVLGFRSFYDSVFAAVMRAYGGSGPFIPNPGSYTEVMFSSAAAFSPNLDYPPYFVDLPIDTSGTLIDSTWGKWLLHSPTYIAAQYARDADQIIRFNCDTQDAYVYPGNVAFADTLDSLGVSFEFQSFQGNDWTNLYEQCAITLTFLDSVMWAGVCRAYYTATDLTYITPGTGEVNITTEITNPSSHTLAASAMFRTIGGSVLDTVDLFDDGNHNDGIAGDRLWGGSWSLPQGERIYLVDVKSVDVDSAISHTNYDVTRFTTIGPVVYDSYVLTGLDTIPQPGDRIYFYLTLRNNGATATAHYVFAEISSSDTCVSNIYRNGALFYSISAGTYTTYPGSNYYAIAINKNCLGEMGILFDLSISSDSHEFWSDSFSVYVYPVSIAEREGVLPTEYALHQNYPNPFNPATTIRYDLPQASRVRLTIYDVMGRAVRTLVQGEQGAGYQSVTWGGSDDRGQAVSSGVYLYRIQAEGFSETRKMVLLR